MLARCPNPRCGQKVVFVKGYGRLPAVCPRCGSDLSTSVGVDNAPPHASLQAGERALSLDGSEMVYVPAGPFLMGSDGAEIEAAFESACRKYQDVLWIWFERELPKRDVDLPGFWIERLPVTCRQYARFCDVSGYKRPDYWEGERIPDGKEDHPVVGVSWEDVLAYCSWTGKRPPYESEWEKAARGTDGRIWPWGNACLASGGNMDCGLASGTTPVGSFPQGASPYGCLDMAGNVFEWTRDICVKYPGYAETDDLREVPLERTPQPNFQKFVVFRDGVTARETRPFQFFGCVVRGGAWASCAEFCRCAFRLEVNSGQSSLGFRCILGEDPCDQARDLGHAGRQDESLAAARRSLALSPNYPTALYNAGMTLKNLGRFEEAVAEFRHLLDVWPSDCDSWNQMGLCQARLKRSSCAIEAYDEAICLNPFNADYWYNKALEFGSLSRELLAPHTLAKDGGKIFVDLSKLPVGLMQAVASRQGEAAGCYFRARRLNPEDNDAEAGETLATQQSNTMLECLRKRLDKINFVLVTAGVDFCRSFPTIQQVWAVIRKYHEDHDFTYDTLRNHGFGDAETSTALTYLEKWGRINVVGLETFRVVHTHEISSYDPWREGSEGNGRLHDRA